MSGLTSAKIQALLAYLALDAERPHPREMLAALLWPEQAGKKALQNLRQSLSRLQRAIPGPVDWLQVTRQTVQCVPGTDLWLDTTVFKESLHFCRQHPHKHLHRCRRCGPKLAEAAAAYRGDFLQGVQTNSAEFDEWALLNREWFRREALGVLYELAQRFLWLGDYEAAHTAAWRQVAIDPLRERAQRQVMISLARSGRRREALRQYQTLHDLLSQELGVTPSAETTILFEEIRQGNLERVTGEKKDELTLRHLTSQLPAQHTPFIGREEELARIAERLDNPHCRLLTLVGFGGVGKSRLAVEIVREKADEYEDGVCYVSLATVPSSELMPPAIADCLGLPSPENADPQARKKQLLEVLKTKEILLVLDNFEHLLPDTGHLVDMLDTAIGLKVLVTSRQPLNLRAEWLVEVVGLPYPAADDSAPIAEFEAVQLFCQSAVRIQPDFALAPATAVTVAQICRLIKGVPLAIELAAAWVRHVPLKDMVREIAQDLDFLATAMPDVPERQRSTRASFAYSWRLLSDEEKRALRGLSVFQGGFFQEAAERICTTTPELIAGLIDKFLLQQRVTGTAVNRRTRYDLHELIRRFAAEKLADRPEQEAQVAERHCDYYNRLLATTEQDLVSHGQPERLKLLNLEAENIRSAWNWAIANQATDAIGRSLEAMTHFYVQRGWMSEAESTLERTATMLLARGAREDPQKARTLGVAEDTALLGRVWVRQGALASILNLEGEKARILLQKGLRILREFDLEEEVAEALRSQAIIDRQSGEFQAARQRLDKSLQIARTSGNLYQVASTLAELAYLAYLQNETEAGRRFGQQCLNICRQASDLIVTGRILNTMGLLESQRGNFGQARRFLTESLEIYRQLGDIFREGAALNNLGLAAYESDEFTEAERRFQESQNISQKVGEPYGVALALYNRGRVAHAREDYALARDLHGQGLKIRLEMANKYLSGISYLYLGKAYLALEEYDLACSCFYQALEKISGSDNAYVQLQILTAVAGEWVRDKRTEEAQILLQFILNHPASTKNIGDFPVRDEAQALLEHIQNTHHDWEQVPASLQGRTLTEVIEDALSEN